MLVDKAAVLVGKAAAVLVGKACMLVGQAEPRTRRPTPPY
jgi:hypothetical protein